MKPRYRLIRRVQAPRMGEWIYLWWRRGYPGKSMTAGDTVLVQRHGTLIDIWTRVA
jgi:hypothetical protein